MSRMADLAADIEELLISTKLTKLEIAERLNIPVEWVDQAAAQLDELFDDLEVRAGFDGYVSENDYFDGE